MEKQLNDRSFNQHFIKFFVVGLLAFVLIGCQKDTELTISNTNDSNNKSVENINAPTANSNTSVNKLNSADEKKLPKVKAFEDKLIGNWSDDKEKVTFTKDEMKFYELDGTLKMITPYRVLDENKVELKLPEGVIVVNSMVFEDNDATLVWKNDIAKFVYKREPSKQ